MNGVLNKTSFIIILTYLVIIGSISYFFIIPTYNNYKSNTAQIEIDQQNYDESQVTLTTYKRLNSQKDEIRKYADKTAKLVPTKPELENYLIDLEAMIAQSAIPASEFKLASLSSVQAANSPSVIQGLSNYQITLNGQSSLANIISLTNQLLSMSRLTEITAFNLTSADNGQLSFDLTGNIFSNSRPNTADPKKPSKILSEAAQKITQYETHGQPIEIQKEDGFGRTNPFQSY